MTTTKTTTRRKKATPATTPGTMPATHTTVIISDICKAENVTEQAFRLALMDIRPDDFDTIKAIPQTQAEQVLATLTSAVKELPSQATTPQLPETQTQQAIQPAPETAQKTEDEPQNTAIVGSRVNSPVAPQQATTGATVPTALVEAIAKADEDIELFDLIQRYRNDQILSNAQTRDGELVMKLREQRLENRALVFDQLRELNSRQPVAPELPELPQALSDEIDSLARELGKQISLS